MHSLRSHVVCARPPQRLLSLSDKTPMQRSIQERDDEAVDDRTVADEVQACGVKNSGGVRKAVTVDCIVARWRMQYAMSRRPQCYGCPGCVAACCERSIVAARPSDSRAPAVMSLIQTVSYCFVLDCSPVELSRWYAAMWLCTQTGRCQQRGYRSSHALCPPPTSASPAACGSSACSSATNPTSSAVSAS